MKLDRGRLVRRPLGLAMLICSPSLLAGCSMMSASGPSIANIRNSAESKTGSSVYLIDLDMKRANAAQAAQRFPRFSSSLSEAAPVGTVIGAGDVLSISIWEAPPAALFGSVASLSNRPSEDGSSALNSANVTIARASAFPDQVVNNDGVISVPFAGQLSVIGLTTHQVETEITRRLRNKAHLPQVMVSFARNATKTATIVGEVERSGVIPLTGKGERVLDALALSGGTRQSIEKMTIQINRGNIVGSLPLEAIIHDPLQNIILAPGDVITAYYQPLSFTALGATGQNKEVQFEATGLTLAQALGRVGGLDDQKANPSGAFIFRFEDPDFLARLPMHSTSESGKLPSSQVLGEAGLIPVIYRIDLRDPASFFAAQVFAIKNKDIIYVSTAPIADVQKFVNIISSSVFPIVSLSNSLNNN
ncbi:MULTISPECIES: polysaccharide biosynthesis/export family protein [unclassified Sphingobium]|uniref:polysaccharide biosynthesis/export family protein n=1 Tax=unclassified Sphingobium TaxID=2611147 RepID=UPI000971549C|nr:MULTISPECIES: polysaccharide biosynthesis/export family protein [unclassified Sphingobium]